MAASAGSLMIDIGTNIARLQADMGKAMKMVDNASRSMSRAFSSVGVAVGGAFSVAGIAMFVKSAIDMADAIGKASVKFGVAVGPLSALKYAAELNEVAFEGLATGLKFLNKSMAEGDKAFGAMGVRLKDSSGNLRTTEDVLLDVAEAFASYKDGAAKTALALQLFGKAGAEMIPFLNQGKAGIREAMEEARRLGVVISTDTAKAADEFNDNLTRLKTSSSGLAVSLASGVLPLLQGMAEHMTDLVGSMQAANREFAKMKAETGQLVPDIEGVWSVPEASTLMSGSEDLVGRKGYEDMGRTPSKRGAPDIKAWEKAAEERKKVEEEGSKRALKLLGDRADALASFYGDDADLAKIAAEQDIARGEEAIRIDKERFRYAEELRGTLDAIGVPDMEMDLANAMPGIESMKAATSTEMWEGAMRAAEAYGNVSLAIQTMNSDLGATQAVLEQNQGWVQLYEQVWRDANLAIVDSISSLYGGMQNWISSSLQGLITGAMTVGDAIKSLGKMMLGIITEYVAKWLVSRLLMAAMEKVFLVQQVATTSFAAGVIAEAWLPAAFLATVATLGGAAYEAPFALGIGMAAAQGLNMAMSAAGTLGGGLSDAINGGTGAAFASGTDFVPATMPALVHKGERIVPEKTNEDLTDFLRGSGDGRNLTVILNVDGEALYKVVRKGVRTGQLNLQLA